MPRGTAYKKLQKLRDRKLCERFYYWTEVKRRRFDDVWKILSEEEFFIGEQRIIQIIRSNNGYIDKLRNGETENAKNQLKLF